MISRQTVTAIRVARGLTLQALADESRLSLATVKRASGTEGDYKCDQSTAKKLADALHVNQNELSQHKLTHIIDVDGIELRLPSSVQPEMIIHVGKTLERLLLMKRRGRESAE